MARKIENYISIKIQIQRKYLYLQPKIIQNTKNIIMEISKKTQNIDFIFQFILLIINTIAIFWLLFIFIFGGQNFIYIVLFTLLFLNLLFVYQFFISFLPRLITSYKNLNKYQMIYFVVAILYIQYRIVVQVLGGGFVIAGSQDAIALPSPAGNTYYLFHAEAIIEVVLVYYYFWTIWLEIRNNQKKSK